MADAAGVSPNLITRYFGGKDGLFLAATRVEIPVEHSFDGDRSSLGSRLAASIVQRWFGMPGEDPLLVLQRASGERPEAAEALAAFLDRSSLEPLHRYLRDSGLDDATARNRAAAIDAFVLGVSTLKGLEAMTSGSITPASTPATCASCAPGPTSATGMPPVRWQNCSLRASPSVRTEP